jgi:hypothetical protein
MNAFQKQIEMGIAPDIITYSSLIAACERAGGGHACMSACMSVRVCACACRGRRGGGRGLQFARMYASLFPPPFPSLPFLIPVEVHGDSSVNVHILWYIKSIYIYLLFASICLYIRIIYYMSLYSYIFLLLYPLLFTLAGVVSLTQGASSWQLSWWTECMRRAWQAARSYTTPS